MLTWEDTTSLLTTQIKICRSLDMDDLESEVNEFLKTVKMVVDIKFNYSKWNGMYIAMIIYREFKEE